MNMSYCRFENALKDLQDCYNNLDQFDQGDLSSCEARAAYDLIQLAINIAQCYEDVDLEDIFQQYQEEN